MSDEVVLWDMNRLALQNVMKSLQDELSVKSI